MGQEGKEGRKERGMTYLKPPHSNMSRYDVHIYLCAQTERANVVSLSHLTLTCDIRPAL